MNNDRPITTLFMIESLDGKISTGDLDELDVDKDYKRITGVKEGLQQYYELQKKTDWVSFNSGKVQAKVGANERTWNKEPDDICFAVVDNKPHLNKQGTEYFAKRSAHFYLITTNKNHPAFELQSQYPTMHILFYENRIDLPDVFRRFKDEFEVEKVTIQTGGTLNAEFLRLGLIDKVSIVVAPCLIGGQDTQSLIGGESLHTQEDLKKVKALKLTKCDILENSYLHVQYEVLNDTQII
ncbi:dihydrofolate reductase family protein [Candidatus Roizmanbacteria bacterium]|nr:dihydrofolate reductase family protein [Candidatus Roizmanbacteria bacterium]